MREIDADLRQRDVPVRKEPAAESGVDPCARDGARPVRRLRMNEERFERRIEIALAPITTAGDRDRSKPLGAIGTRGVFVQELEAALLERRIAVRACGARERDLQVRPEGDQGSGVECPAAKCTTLAF